jgi:hypothetical protein
MPEIPMATFVVHTRRTGEVLNRVVSLFHKRAIDVERLIADVAMIPTL